MSTERRNINIAIARVDAHKLSNKLNAFEVQEQREPSV